MQRQTHIIDAEQQIAGRLASQIAFLLQGKNKAEYEPHIDRGDSVEVKNVAGMRFTGKKMEDKVYYRSTRYPGGIRTTKLSDRMARDPEQLLRDMVYAMLPKNKLRDRMIKRLSFISSKSTS